MKELCWVLVPIQLTPNISAEFNILFFEQMSSNTQVHTFYWVFYTVLQAAHIRDTLAMWRARR